MGRGVPCMRGPVMRTALSPAEQHRSGFRFDGTASLSGSQATGLGADDRTPSFMEAAVLGSVP
jgi:hypothetical protein